MLAKQGTLLGIVCVLSTIISGTAHGKPDWGTNCASCHDPATGRIAVTAHDTTLDVGTQLDGQKHGALKTFVAGPGDTVALSVNVSDGGGKYALQLIGLDKGGQQNSTSNKLSYTADSTWSQFNSGGLYYTLSDTSNGVRTFNLTINAGTPADVYDLIFGIGLKSGGVWYQEEHFYVQVVDNTPAPANLVISGMVKTANGTAVSGVQLTGGGIAATNAAGAYSITVPYDFSGTITPAHANYTFEPASVSYNGLTADAANENYIAVGVVVTPTTVTITGTVATADGTPVEGVAVGAGGGSAITDAAGGYTLTVSEGFSGTVTPAKASYTFEPASKTYTNVTGDLSGADYTATVSTVYSIADHVFLAEIHQAWDYNDPANPDDLAYVFYLAVETDDTVSLVEVLTPAGNTLQIPADAHTQTGNVQTWRHVDGATNVWAYEASMADVGGLAYYGDGAYTVGVHHTDTSQGQTTVLFGVAGSIEPIAQPTQEPVLTAPAHNGQIASPVTFEWAPYTEAVASVIRLELIAADGAITATDFAADATGSAPVSLAAGNWGAKLSFENGNEYSNADGITCVVVKYSESAPGFTVETAGGGDGGSGAGQEVIVDNNDPGASSTGPWRTSGGKNPHGADSLWSRDADATFTFNANLTPDRYAVFMHWTLWPSRMTDDPVEIRDAGTLLDTVSVNQKLAGGQWNLLGIYTLSETASVTIISHGPGSTNADAVRFVPISALDELVIDNGAPGTFSTGRWKKSGGANPYGSNSLWSRDAGATYTWSSPLTGTFAVYVRWTLWPSRMTDVPVEVYDGQTLLDTAYADQQTAGAQWNYVGTYTFNESAAVTAISQGPGSTNADAVRFIPAQATPDQGGNNDTPPDQTDNPDSGQGGNADVVTVIKADYKVESQEIIVRATSTEQPIAILTVEGYGEMTFIVEKNRYELRIKPASDPGDSITVTSSSGGSAEDTVKREDDD